MTTAQESIKIRNCAKHGDYESKTIPAPFGGREFYTKCPTCQAEDKRRGDEQQKLSEASVKQNRIKKLLGMSGIPKRFMGRSFDNFRVETTHQRNALAVSRYFAENFDNCLSTGASLLFCGNPGTGKTHLASAIANDICNKGRSAVFMNVFDAIATIKDTWRNDSAMTEKQAYSALTEPDLLILDEVGVQFGTEAEKIILFKILNGRYIDVKPTIVISNLTPEGINEYLGDRVVDRLREGGGSVVVFNWESYRTRVLSDEALPKSKVKPVNWGSQYVSNPDFV
jgi:DNA replication protein DnaC